MWSPHLQDGQLRQEETLLTFTEAAAGKTIVVHKTTAVHEITVMALRPGGITLIRMLHLPVTEDVRLIRTRAGQRAGGTISLNLLIRTGHQLSDPGTQAAEYGGSSFAETSSPSLITFSAISPKRGHIITISSFVENTVESIVIL